MKHHDDEQDEFDVFDLFYDLSDEPEDDVSGWYPFTLSRRIQVGDEIVGDFWIGNPSPEPPPMAARKLRSDLYDAPNFFGGLWSGWVFATSSKDAERKLEEKGARATRGRHVAAAPGSSGTVDNDH